MDATQTRGRVLVTGATGIIGSVVVAVLTEQGVPVRALVRDESKAKGLAESGVEIAVGDLDRPETLDAAFTDVDRAFLVTPVSPNAGQQGRNFIAAAQRAGEPHIVRLSAAKCTLDSPNEAMRLHAETEADLAASGLRHTIFRTNTFMQTTLMAAPTVASEGAIYMPLKDGRLGLVDVRDIADCAVTVFAGTGHHGKTYTLTGPASVSFTEIALALSEALDKDVAYVDISLEACREGLVGMGVDDWTADLYVDFFEAFSENRFDFTTDDVETLTGSPARSYEQFAADFAGVFGGTTDVA